jgi:hypothetical protein
MKTIAVALLLGIGFSLQAQTEVSVDEWKSVKIPTNEDTLNNYSQKGKDWMVYSSNGKVMVKPEPKENEKKLPFVLPPARFGAQKYLGSKTFIEVDNGYLLAFNGGEYGGKFFWYSKDGLNNYMISKQVVTGFIKRDERVFAIEASENSSVIEIKKENDKWVTTESVKLPAIPDAIGMDEKKNFIIVTVDNIIQVSPEGKITTLLKEGFWSILLFPNSLVVKGDDVYVGMRQGVLKFNTKTRKEEWLVKE